MGLMTLTGRVGSGDPGPGPEILVGTAEERPMYAAVRRYEGINDDDEAARLVRDSFMPQLEKVPGFVT